MLALAFDINLLSLFSCSDVSDSLRPYGLQHARLPYTLHYLLEFLLKFMSIASVMLSNHLILCCPLLLLPSIFSSIREIILMSWLFASRDQSIRASATVLPMNIQGWFPLGLISLLSKGLSKVSSTTIRKHQFFSTQVSLWSNSNIHTWLLEKP